MRRRAGDAPSGPIVLISKRTALLAAPALLAPLLTALPADARCPNEAPDAPACEPIVSAMMPSLEATAYFPKGGSGPYYGGGVDFVLVSWSSSNDAFGPSQGSLRLGASYMFGQDDRRLLLYRFGALVSIERNASRRFLIPYFGGALGALWETDFGNRALAEASLGRLARVIGGGTYSRRSPFAAWFEDVRALGFLRPPWALAYDNLFGTSFG